MVCSILKCSIVTLEPELTVVLRCSLIGCCIFWEVFTLILALENSEIVIFLRLLKSEVVFSVQWRSDRWWDVDSLLIYIWRPSLLIPFYRWSILLWPALLNIYCLTAYILAPERTWNHSLTRHILLLHHTFFVPQRETVHAFGKRKKKDPKPKPII